MNLDLTRLPVLEGIVAFLLLALGITFVFAFKATGGIEEEVSGSPTPTPGSSGSPSGNQLAITLGDNKFSATDFNVPAGSAVTFSITNSGKATHDMRIAGPDGDYQTSDDGVSDPDAIRAGKTATLTWTAPAQPGQIQFHCDFHPDQMKGTITVQ